VWSREPRACRARERRGPARDALRRFDRLRGLPELVVRRPQDLLQHVAPHRGPLPAREPLMALAAGMRLGPCEIKAPLGAGGMGQVWQATDTRLGRSVALKLLPDAFASDRARLPGFEREGKRLGGGGAPEGG